MDDSWAFFSSRETTLPTLLDETDVTIYHPNGYLPAVGTASGTVVFSESSFEKRMSIAGDDWRRLLNDILLSRVGLFIGISGDDPMFGPALQDIKAKIGSKRTTGFWMRGPGETLGADYFLSRNVVPLEFPKFEEYPTFLFGICRDAAS